MPRVCLVIKLHNGRMCRFIMTGTILGQIFSSDWQQPDNTSKYSTPTINHPSTTMPPAKTGHLTEFEKGQIVALKEKNLSFSEIGKILSHPKAAATCRLGCRNRGARGRSPQGAGADC